VPLATHILKELKMALHTLTGIVIPTKKEHGFVASVINIDRTTAIIRPKKTWRNYAIND